MKKFSSKTQKIGQIGENIVCQTLIHKGFKIENRNYTEKWGEIDIVAKKDEVTRFIEVKSVSCESFDTFFSRETDVHRPEDQMHAMKRKRLMKTIQTYLLTHKTDAWQFDLACVYMNMEKRRARIQMLENVILE